MKKSFITSRPEQKCLGMVSEDITELLEFI